MDINYTLNESVKNNTNFTTDDVFSEYFYAQNISLKILAILLQLSVILSMGTIISIEEILSHMKQPISVIIALISQFFAMPFCAVGIIILLQLSPASSVGALILACSPGGSASNLFTFICDGDVSLSITLTTISTTLALGFMPLNLWIYARRWTDNQTLTVPYVGILINLTMILILVAIGMLIKKYHPNVAVIINKIGSVLGIIFLVLWLTIQNIFSPKSIFLSEGKFWIVAGAISICGFCIGLFMSLISRRPSKHVKTIAIETGVQSVSVALTVIFTSFPKNLHSDMISIPEINGIFTFLVVIFLALLMRIYSKFKRKTITITIKNEQVVSTVIQKEMQE